jgi:hypothetical protein
MLPSVDIREDVDVPVKIGTGRRRRPGHVDLCYQC